LIEKVLPLYEASKIIDKQDIISISECPCKLERALLGDPCKTASDIYRCLHFGNIARYFIEHNLGKPISKDEAKLILKQAEEEGLVHKTFHDDLLLHSFSKLLSWNFCVSYDNFPHRENR